MRIRLSSMAATAALVLATPLLPVSPVLSTAAAESEPLPVRPAYAPPLPLGQSGVDGEVTRMYLALLDRRPDEAGLDYWVERRQEGMAIHEVAALFHDSPEFAQRFGYLLDAETSTWVDLLYERILGRPADADGKAYWIDQVDSGRATREQLIVHFSQSEEFQIATGTGRAGFAALVQGSRAEYAALGDDYVYTWEQSHFLGRDTTTYRVVDGEVTERSYDLRPWDPDFEATSWTEVGDAVGSHPDGAPARTIPQVHDECQGLLASLNPWDYELILEVDDSGRLRRCGGTSPYIADGGDELVGVTGLAVS